MAVLLSTVVIHNGNVLWYEHSEPYDKTMTRVSQTGQEILNDRVGTRKGYTRHLNDTAADLVYMKAWYYDPQILWFYSNDPVGFSVGHPMMFNRYGYAYNNPYGYVDPDGRQGIRNKPWARSPHLESLVICDPSVIHGNPSTGSELTDVVILVAVAYGLTMLSELSDDEAGIRIEHIETSKDSPSTADELIDLTKEDGVSRRRTRMLSRDGGFDQANRDFDGIVDPVTIVDRGEGVRTEGTEERVEVNVRPTSTDGSPTVEIQNRKNGTKIRYDQ